MIVTLTPNPSLDLLFSAERLVWDDANRIPTPRRRAGGQGINVVRAARALEPGIDARAIAALGGPVGRELQEGLEAEGTPLTPVRIAGDTRVFVGVRESATGRSLLLNPRGPEITAAEADALLAAVDEVLTGVRTPAVADDPVAASGSTGSQESPDTAPWFLACGSLLPGLSADFYARAGRLARDRGARFVPDCDGAALAAAAEEADLLVPNEMEAERLAGLTVRDPVTAAAAGRKLLRRGPRRVVVTLGAKGAVAVDDAGAWWARPAPSSPDAGRLALGSAVGAGDAFLAGLVQALDRAVSGEAALADAVAAGTATLLSRGSALVRRADFEEAREWVRVERLPDRL